MSLKPMNEFRQWLVTENRPLVYHIVNRSTIGLHLGRDERLGVGMLSLCQAAALFDPYQGTKFGTYAYWAILNGLVIAVREGGVIRVTRTADRDKASEETQELARRARRVYSFFNAEGELRFDPADYRSQVDPTSRPDERIDRLERAIQTLPANDRTVMTLRLRGAGCMEIARTLGISKQRVHQITTRAFAEVKYAMKVAEELAQ